jgi:ADP-ribosyl-[dinitrogen reductase] hydrolase
MSLHVLQDALPGAVTPGLLPALDAALLQRGQAAYLGLATGDALGATVEFMTPREIQATHGTHRQIQGGGWLHLRPGQVTDDTTMALALGQSILSAGQVDARACGAAFDAWMRAKPVDIGNTVRRGILEFRRTGRLEAPPSEHDAGNGACMRVLPVALATLGQPEAEIRAACRRQAHLTHHNPLSDAGTEAVVLMLQAALRGGGRDALLAHIQALAASCPLFDPAGKRVENPSGYIVDTLRAVFQALIATHNLEACLVDVVNRGGDADTTGAIAGMLAGAAYGLDALPQPWLLALEAPSREACLAQSRALLELATARTGNSG